MNGSWDMAGRILVSGRKPRSGEALGLTEDQKLPVTRSKGVFADGFSLKIEYKPVKQN